MPLMDRIKYNKAVMVFKSLNGLASSIHERPVSVCRWGQL